jgi:hypothetical protein
LKGEERGNSKAIIVVMTKEGQMMTNENLTLRRSVIKKPIMENSSDGIINRTAVKLSTQLNFYLELSSACSGRETSKQQRERKLQTFSLQFSNFPHRSNTNNKKSKKLIKSFAVASRARSSQNQRDFIWEIFIALCNAILIFLG